MELRKEKSRDAARSRRGKENFEFYELAKVSHNTKLEGEFHFKIGQSQFKIERESESKNRRLAPIHNRR